MTKTVPASRRVTEASLEPPVNMRRSRAIKPAGTVTGSASITATAKNDPERRPHAGGDGPVYQPSVKIRLDASASSSVSTSPQRGEVDLRLAMRSIVQCKSGEGPRHLREIETPHPDRLRDPTSPNGRGVPRTRLAPATTAL